MSVPPNPQELADDVSVGAPHVVILGAGASLAACPGGDANGKVLPLMSNLLDVIGMADQLPIKLRGWNFEEVYAELLDDPDGKELADAVEIAIREYFAGLRLPETTTIYDELLLGLRPKDVIATFNWDPFLVQAVQRVCRRGARPPELLFLHGNVTIGYCHDHKFVGAHGLACPECDAPFGPAQLLYPVADKDYAADKGIAAAWRTLASALDVAFMVTVFGYSAPASDAAAKELLKTAWGSGEEREFEEFEIIDIRDAEDLRTTWDDFIHTHHYEVHRSFHDSSIALTPRRTGEAYVRRILKGQWVSTNPAPRESDLTKLVSWHDDLRSAESNR